MVAIALLRLYNGIFQYPVTVRSIVIAKKIRWQMDAVEQTLRQLHSIGIIDYKPATDGPQMHVHHYRVNSNHLQINTARILRLREQHEARTAVMIGFLQEQNICRSKLLLEYFGEAANAHCGHCDICLKKKQLGEWNEQTAAATIKMMITESTITLQELTSRFPHGVRGQVLLLLRRMIDDGHFTLQPDSTLASTKKNS
jgi:ATP-dependent DNA helicase RecQ